MHLLHGYYHGSELDTDGETQLCVGDKSDANKINILKGDKQIKKRGGAPIVAQRVTNLTSIPKVQSLALLSRLRIQQLRSGVAVAVALV